MSETPAPAAPQAQHAVNQHGEAQNQEQPTTPEVPAAAPEPGAFIGRSEELNQIDRWVAEWHNWRTICLGGPGGIGKTRLLHELWQRWRSRALTGTKNLRLLELLDFDEAYLRVPQNIRWRIATQLGLASFEPYRTALQDYRRMEEQGGYSSDALNRQREQIETTFVGCFDAVAKQQPLLIGFDTLDAIQQPETRQSLIDLLQELQHVCFIVAGRNAGELSEQLRQRVNQPVEYLELQLLQSTDSVAYVERQKELLHTQFDPELVEKILFLAQGKPILLDLATQWLAEDIPLPWLIDESLDDLKALSAEQQAQRQDEFEAKLVAAITETRRDIDWLFLALALVEPMDSQMIQDIVLQSDDQQKAEDLFERAKTFIFIKVLPDGRIRLHDEMRRMIKKHAWPLVDPDKDRWRAICQIGAGYLERVMQDTETKIAALKAAKKHKSADRDVEAFLEQDGLERTLWVDRVRQLELILEANLQKGIDRFRRLFDEASSVDFRESVLGKVGEYEKHFDLSQRYDYTLRLVQQRYDRGQHRQVKDRVSAFLEQHAAELTPRQQMALQIEYGVAEVNLGDPNAGVERLTEAITIGEEHQLQDKLAEVHNIRGWAYRTRGSYDDALQDYKQAYALSLEQRNRSDMAQALNQIGYVEGLKGERNLAIEHCQQALKSWESLKKSGGIVSTCSSLGEIYWWSDEPDRAMKLYERALTIADQAILSDWSARVRCKRALIFCDQQLYAEAQADLAYAWDNGPNILRPRIRHGEGTVLRKQGKIEQAYQKFNEALELSRQMYETEYEFQSFFALADLAWEQRQFATWQQFDEQYRERFADSLIVSLKGGALRAIGDLALGAGQYDKALELYQKGLPLIAKYLDPPFTVTLQLGIIESRLMERQDVQQMMTQLGKDLMEFWQKQPELLDRHPEALLIFDEWQQKGQEV